MATLPHAPDIVLERLTQLHPKLIDLSLDRVAALLDRLGNPHRTLPPVVHVAGTNGKGSVVAFLRAALQAAGYRVHVYTSPHLVRFNERVVVAGETISDEALVAVLEECERVNGNAPITFFEITTVAAFLAFARTPADVVLLETGLGGRLDATNLIDTPALTAITPVSLDHQQFLGNTLAEIAGEKAGILKPGVPCVVAAQEPEAIRVIRRQAKKRGVTLIEEGRDFASHRDGDHLVFSNRDGKRTFPKPALIGTHQFHNAGVAIACLSALEIFKIGDDAIADGLQNVSWPARLQRLTAGPLVEKIPAGWELWLDGGHNIGAGAVLAEQVAHWADKPLFLVFGMLDSKAPSPFLAPLRRFVRSLQAVAIPNVKAALGAEDAAWAARTVGIEAQAAPDIGTAFDRIIAAETAPARILICGSLYLAGEILKENR
ncbi:MAG: folylpolyglutamate synthase/dihydrofolate synthase family protein [Rhodospirillales bacterium]